MFFENRLVIFFLLFLAVLSGVEVYFLHSQSMHHNKNYGHYPDSFGINLQLNRFDQTGFLSESISAKRAIHFPDTKTTEFQTILMQVFNHKQHAPWVITAPKGIAYGKGEKIVISGPAHMQQAASPNNPASSLDTQDVTILTDQKLMLTDGPVFAEQPGIHMQGIGARYDYSQDILDILNQVHVYYQPKEAKK